MLCPSCRHEWTAHGCTFVLADVANATDAELQEIAERFVDALMKATAERRSEL